MGELVFILCVPPTLHFPPLSQLWPRSLIIFHHSTFLSETILHNAMFLFNSDRHHVENGKDEKESGHNFGRDRLLNACSTPAQRLLNACSMPAQRMLNAR